MIKQLTTFRHENLSVNMYAKTKIEASGYVVYISLKVVNVININLSFLFV